MATARSRGSDTANTTANARKDTAQVVLDGRFTTRSQCTLDGLGQRRETPSALLVRSHAQKAAMLHQLVTAFSLIIRV